MRSIHGPEGPKWFLKYFQSLVAKGYIEPTDEGFQAAKHYDELYNSENPDIQEINDFIEYLELSDFGSVTFDLIQSTIRWRDKIINKDK